MIFGCRTQWILIISLLIPLMGCQSLSSYLPQKNNPQIIYAKTNTLYYYPGKFDQLYVRGKVTLTIHTGARRPWLTIHGDTRDLEQIKWSVKNDILRVRMEKSYPKYGPVTVDVGAKQLKMFMYRGKGNVTGRRLYSKKLDVIIISKKPSVTVLEGRMNLRHVILRGSGKVLIKNSGTKQQMDVTIVGKTRVKLLGTTNLQELTMADYSSLILPSIKTKRIKVTMEDYARLQIKGSAQWANIDLSGYSRFYGRYLKLNEAFVKTHNYARAYIAISDKQHTLAMDSSDIYYYKVPTYNNNFMGKSGSVLNLGSDDE